MNTLTLAAFFKPSVVTLAKYTPKCIMPVVINLAIKFGLWWSIRCHRKEAKQYDDDRQAMIEKYGVYYPPKTMQLGIVYEWINQIHYPFPIVPAALKLETTTNRGNIYIEPIVESYRRFFDKDSWPVTPHSIGMDRLYDMITNTPPAHYLFPYDPNSAEIQLPEELECKDECHVCDISVVTKYLNNPEFYYEIDTMYLYPKGKRVVLRTTDGEFHDLSTAPNREVLKLYAMSHILDYSIGMAHNWVHFFFPDIFCALAYNLLPNDSLAYKLVLPHIRYVLQIKDGMGDGASTNNDLNSMADDIVPTVMGPVDQEYFTGRVAERAYAYYSGKSAAIDSDLKHINFSIPPNYDTTTRYRALLMKLYDVTLRHVTRIVASIRANQPAEIQLLEKFKFEVIKRINTSGRLNNASISLEDFLATYIHQSSFIHSLDHQHIYAFGYGFNAATLLRKPYAQVDRIEDIYQPYDMVRTNNMMNVFVHYHPNHEVDDSMEGLDYEFGIDEMDAGAEQFKKESGIVLKDYYYDFNAEYCVELGLGDIAQSICF
jgi:hypothetical protein